MAWLETSCNADKHFHSRRPYWIPKYQVLYVAKLGTLLFWPQFFQACECKVLSKCCVSFNGNIFFSNTFLARKNALINIGKKGYLLLHPEKGSGLKGAGGSTSFRLGGDRHGLLRTLVKRVFNLLHLLFVSSPNYCHSLNARCLKHGKRISFGRWINVATVKQQN